MRILTAVFTCVLVCVPCVCAAEPAQADPGSIYAATSQGVFKSTDGGSSWTSANTGLEGIPVVSLARDPVNLATLYAGASGARVFKSTNGGQSWTAASAGLTDSIALSLAIDPVATNTIYVGTATSMHFPGQQVFKTTNGGQDWTIANSGLPKAIVEVVAVDPKNPAIVYAGTNFAGVYKTINGGQSWSATGMATGFVEALVIDPIHPATLYAGLGGCSFNCLGSAGVFKSTDGGMSWTAVNSGLTDLQVVSLAVDRTDPNILYAGTRLLGVFKSTNGGGNWNQVNPNLGSAALAITLNPGTVYAGTANGLFKSSDGGTTWASANTGLPASTSVFALSLEPTAANVPPYGLELSPYQGAATTQTFTGTFNDANGWTDIAKATLFFHESYAGTFGTCTVEMRPQTGQITLLDDAGVNYLTPVSLGSATPLQNSACSVDALNSNFSGAGNVLTANVALTFKPAFGSAGGREPRKAICQWAKDTAGAGEPQSCLGMWLPEAPAPVKIPRYRLYFPQNYEHFFTASQNERDTLVARGMHPEDPPPGMAYNQPATISGVPTQPFYRILFFPNDPKYGSLHYWTRDREEYKAAVRVRGLNVGEGMDSFLLSAQVPGTLPTYRLRFTAGPSPFPIYHYALKPEHDALVGMGWGVSMGVDGYLQPFQLADAAKAPVSARVENRISAVLNAASHESGAVAPGQLVRVYRRDLSKLAQAFIDGSAVPLTAITDKYVELMIPERVAGKESIELSIDDLGVRAEAVTVPVAAARPAVFVKDFIGRGHIETLPSEPGTVTLQLTGAGELDLGQPKLPLSVRLNGYPADILSISTINNQPGRLAVNVKLPAEVLAADTEIATLSLQAGEATAQPGLLVRVK